MVPVDCCSEAFFVGATALGAGDAFFFSVFDTDTALGALFLSVNVAIGVPF
jgi:hypothetical protein